MDNSKADKFDPSVVAITTNTYYPNWYRGKLKSLKHTDKIRGDLAFEFFKKTLEIGYQIVVSDALSSRSFRHELKNIKGLNVVFKRTAKRSPNKRHAIKTASRLKGVKVVVTTEPEKLSLLDNIPQIINPILKDEIDIVVPKRNEELFKATYPDYMHQSEIEANELYNELLKSFGLITENQEFDMFFGPRVIKNNKKTTSLFMKKFIFKDSYPLLKYFDPEDFSDVLFFPIIEALKKGLKVKSVEIPFSYPFLQKKNEESGERELFLEKRKSQKMGLLIDLMHFISYLERNPASMIKSVNN